MVDLVIRAIYSQGVVRIPDFDEANSLYQDGYGSFKARRLTLTSCEALYLLEKGRIKVVDKEMELSFNELLGRLSSRDERLWTSYIVYRDLRIRGYVVREMEGEVSFLVYERGAYPKEAPSYEVYALWEGSPRPLYELIESLRRAEKGGRTMKIAVVDRRGELVYYTVREMEFEGGCTSNDSPAPLTG